MKCQIVRNKNQCGATAAYIVDYGTDQPVLICKSCSDQQKKVNSSSLVEISRDWIMKNLEELHTEKGEALGDMESHSMDLSDVFENTENRFNTKIRYLENLLKV